MSEVFISYARRANRERAAALHDALAAAGIAAFLYTDAIEDGDRFPSRLVDGVLDARAVHLRNLPVPLAYTQWPPAAEAADEWDRRADEAERQRDAGG